MSIAVRNFDPGQIRDPDGTWGDGMPGPDLPDLDTGGFTVTADVDGTFGQLVMGFDNVGDVLFAFHEHTGNEIRAREMGLGSDELADLADALESLADRRDEAAASDTPAGHVFDAIHFGSSDENIAELMPNGMIVIVFGVEDDEPWSLSLDPPSEDDGDDVATVVEGIDDTLAEVGIERSAIVERKFDISQKRDGDGQWSDGGALKDTLKLDGKIGLGPDEKLIGSWKVDGDQAGARLALTERNGQRMLRLGLGGEMYGQRNRDEGTPAWDGNPSRAPLPEAEHQRLDAEFDALSVEYDSASPARQDEISARQDDIKDQLVGADEGFNGTAKLDEYSMRRLADRIRPALAEAVGQEKTQNAAWDEIKALEAKGNFDPARMAELRRIARADETDFITFDSGIIAGSEWGDVHYSVELDDASVGAYVTLGVTPKGAPDDWGDELDWRGQFDAAETRKLLRLLDKLSPDAQRSRSPENGAAPVGGQFAVGGGRVGGKGKKPTTRRRPRKPAAPAGPMSFDGKSGTGYGIKGGDAGVRTLQSTLNRLGLTDSSGAVLALDGRYGPRTTAAVKKLQKALGIEADGKVTPELLKQATELKQLPGPTRKPRAPRKSGAKSAGARRSAGHLLDNGTCVTCAASRSSVAADHVHVLDNGICQTCT